MKKDARKSNLTTQSKRDLSTEGTAQEGAGAQYKEREMQK